MSRKTLNYRRFVDERIVAPAQARLEAAPSSPLRDNILRQIREDRDGLIESLVAGLLDKLAGEGPTPEIGPEEQALLSEVLAEIQSQKAA